MQRCSSNFRLAQLALILTFLLLLLMRRRKQQNSSSSSAATSLLPVCPKTPPNLLGFTRIISQNNPTKYFDSAHAIVKNSTDFSWSDLIERHGADFVADGGRYKPRACRARRSAAIVILYRNREQHLRIWLNHMLPLLKRQQLGFKVYIIEQSSSDGAKFNRGALHNVGYVEALRDEPHWPCLIFHDVDLLAENDANFYECDPQHNPKHMSMALGKNNYKFLYKRLMGGVTAYAPRTFRDINGYSNRYWGWGGEDDDMWLRTHSVRLPHPLHVVRPPLHESHYVSLWHPHAKRREQERRRLKLRKTAKLRRRYDGLLSLVYDVESIERHVLFTRIVVKLRNLH